MNKVAVFLVCLTASACASYSGSSLRAGSSTEAEVRATMGAPATELTSPDGTRSLFYPKGPMGTETFLVTIARDGTVGDIRNVLTDDTFSSIAPGMTEQDVLRMIGPPGKTTPFPISNNHAWDYRFMDTWGYYAIFSVTFDANGIVVSKITNRLEGRERIR